MQSSQTAMSGGIGVVAPATVWLSTMRKLLSDSGLGAEIDDVDSADRRQWRRLSAQPAVEFVDTCARTLHFEEDRARIVADESGKPELAGDPVDERAEPHALDDTGHGEPLPDVDGLRQACQSSSRPRPINSRPAIACSAPARSVFSTTKPM